MRKLSLAILVLICLSCSENSERFIPLDKTEVENKLQRLIPSQSKIVEVNNNKQNLIQSAYDVQIDIMPNTFFSGSENSDIDFRLNMIEMKDFSEFISQGITNRSNDNSTELQYCLYIDAEANGESISLQEGNSLTVRIPSELASNNLVIGRGYARDGEIEWDYSNTSISESMKLVSWEVENDDSSLTQFSGYEFDIPTMGWYSIATTSTQVVTYQDVCVETFEGFNSDNSLIFLIDEDESFLNKLNDTESGNLLCSFNIPLSSDQIQILGISYANDSFYSTVQSVDVADITQDDIQLNEPSPISDEELKMLLESF